MASRQQHISLPLLPKQPSGPVPFLGTWCHLPGSRPCSWAAPQHSTAQGKPSTQGKHCTAPVPALWGHSSHPGLTAAVGTTPTLLAAGAPCGVKPSPAFIKAQAKGGEEFPGIQHGFQSTNLQAESSPPEPALCHPVPLHFGTPSSCCSGWNRLEPPDILRHSNKGCDPILEKVVVTV